MEKLELPSSEIVMKWPQRPLAKLDSLEIICEESWDKLDGNGQTAMISESSFTETLIGWQVIPEAQ